LPRRLCSKVLAVCCIALACIFCVVLTLRTFAGILRLKVRHADVGCCCRPARPPACLPATALVGLHTAAGRMSELFQASCC
jgi:hypothetical protein